MKYALFILSILSIQLACAQIEEPAGGGQQSPQKFPEWYLEVGNLLKEAYPELKTPETRKEVFMPKLAKAWHEDPHALLLDEEFMGRLPNKKKAFFLVMVLNMFMFEQILIMLFGFMDQLGEDQQDIKATLESEMVPEKIGAVFIVFPNLESRFNGRFTSQQKQFIDACTTQIIDWEHAHYDFIKKYDLVQDMQTTFRQNQ
jgi:hypothetical protein